MSDEFDVVVVGAGSAGCTLAGRLTEDPALRVLVLEAGGSDDVLEVTQVPAALYKVGAPAGLELRHRPAAGAGRPGAVLAAGQAAGGSSSINAMIYVRGAAADYDEWAELTGDPAWSYAEVLPLFRRGEDNSRGADEFHGTGGPLRVEDLRSPHRWTTAVVDSAVAAGHPATATSTGHGRRAWAPTRSPRSGDAAGRPPTPT
ncbi:choline dehydrogenase-like flavoprotein [Modestobacter versicolor]|uniref:Choline dehydrogenase-like flavoprotein n=1 Tax=Modestobacter versicolor TaxID=429133 RepID=A0A839Y6E2_9ACTN|nr:choline dehydrogenase-like flavoprotein [Modestobacter versicolor]